MSYFKNISLIVLFAYFIINTAQSQNTVPQFRVLIIQYSHPHNPQALVPM